jgi:hypothetical protein
MGHLVHIISHTRRASRPWAEVMYILNVDGWAGSHIISDGDGWAHLGNIVGPTYRYYYIDRWAKRVVTYLLY